MSFNTLGLSNQLTDALTKAGFTTPTPIQEAAIPVALKGGDLIGIAQTGTGKTLAFGLPIINKLIAEPTLLSLVVVPTRELAAQVESSLRPLLRQINPQLTTACIIGGEPGAKQVRDLRGRPSIVVATPGRLNDHIKRGSIRLARVGILILDEADRMLDMGFAPQIKAIVDTITGPHQTMLFSATMAPEIERLTAQYLTSPQKIAVTPNYETRALIEQELCYVSKDSKKDLLEQYLRNHNGKVLVFSRTKHGARKLTLQVAGFGHTVTEIHANRSLGQRRAALEGFKNGRHRVMVATDIASRGIDVQDIELVINYDLPDAAEDYVHRIGRTGRAGKTGRAVSFATPDQQRDVAGIERLTGQTIPLSPHSVTPVRPYRPAPAFRSRSRHSAPRRYIRYSR